MAKRQRKPSEEAGVVFLRVDPDLARWLGEFAERSGKSRNALGEGALQEFREVVETLERMQGEPHAAPDDFVPALGAQWVHRLLSMGLGGEAMRHGWREYLADVERERAEIAADRAERRARK